MAKDLKASADDANLAVKIDLSPDELSYLEKLLNYEIVFQVRHTLDEGTANPDKVVKLLTLFQTFRMMDDQLLDFLHAMKKYHKHMQNTGMKPKDTMVLSQGVVKMYSLLVTETVKMSLPKEMVELKDQFNDAIANKIDNALKKAFDPAELGPEFVKLTGNKNTKKTTKKTETAPAPKETDPALRMVNIFSVKKGIA